MNVFGSPNIKYNNPTALPPLHSYISPTYSKAHHLPSLSKKIVRSISPIDVTSPLPDKYMSIDALI